MPVHTGFGHGEYFGLIGMNIQGDALKLNPKFRNQFMSSVIIIEKQNMALPKKGLRKLTVDEKKYYWTVKRDYYIQSLVIGIGLVAEPNKHIKFHVSYKDPWVEFPDSTTNDVNVISPKLVREAILFANVNDDIKWSGKKDSIMKYEDGQV